MRPAAEIGDLAEVLVTYQLSVEGLAVFSPSCSHVPYDLLVDTQSGTFVRIQVKGATSPRIMRGQPSNTYVFNLKRGQRGAYTTENLDWFAFVALDIEKVLYVSAKEVLSKNITQTGILASKIIEEAEASKQAVVTQALQVEKGLAYCSECSRLTPSS